MNINPGIERSPLSVDDLSDLGTTPARKISDIHGENVQARFLVKAFKDFILPIVHAQAPRSAANQANKKNINDNTDRAGLGPAAQQLVEALENFIVSLVNPEVIRRDGAHIKEVSDIREKTELHSFVQPTVDRTQLNSLSPKATERPRLLKLALEAARHRVFNKMPIRLLALESDGSGIKLLDRSATWDHVSPLVETGFDENEINKDIERRTDPVNNPGAEEQAIEHFISPYTRYAILSHTWLHDKPGEMTYGDWNSGNIDTESAGYQKLSTFCKVAAEEHGITLAWMDTICINKESSAELDESIRSMYSWYRDASICITYLAQTTTLTHMRNDMWFTRGWTLQELLSPRYIKFYGTSWQQLVPGLSNDKEDHTIQIEIVAATTITSNELNNTTPSSISRKMQWAANRSVTREEDIAYSLMGIFDVSISIAYGEGVERAFFRLVQQILSSKGRVQDITNWGHGPETTRTTKSSAHFSSLIPSHPRQYLWCTPNRIQWPLASIPVTLTHLGLHLSVLLMPASIGDPNSKVFYPIGNYYANITVDEAIVDLDASTGSQMLFPRGQRYDILDKATRTIPPAARRHQVTFGVLNFTTTEASVCLPLSAEGIICFAVGLHFGNSTPAEAVAAKNVQVIRTRNAIAFDLRLHQLMGDAWPNWRTIPKKDLVKHGMQLLDMYL